ALAGGVATFAWHGPVLGLLLRSLPPDASALAGPDGAPRIAVTHVGEGFALVLKLSLAGGIAVAMPVWLVQLGRFVAPAFDHASRPRAAPFVAVGVGLFAAGVATAFATLRYPVAWLLRFDERYFAPIITAGPYASFVASLVLVFGLAFELPLVLVLLV